MKKILKFLLYVFSAYHIVLGLIGVLFVGNAELVKKMVAMVFNFNLTMDAQAIWMLKPIAAYMLIMGIIAFFAAQKPSAHKSIIYAIAVLVLIRSIQRIFFALQGNEFLLNADPIRNIVVIVCYLFMAAVYY